MASILQHHPNFANVRLMMRHYRALFPLLLTFLLLFAQQSGFVHVLNHVAVEQGQQQDKHAPHSSACGYCAAYTQIGSAIGSSSSPFTVILLPSGTVQSRVVAFASVQPVTAIARGPPGLLQKIA